MLPKLRTFPTLVESYRAYYPRIDAVRFQRRYSQYYLIGVDVQTLELNGTPGRVNNWCINSYLMLSLVCVAPDPY